MQRITLGTSMRFLGIILLVCSLLLYVRFQARNLITGPVVTLDETYAPFQHTQTIMLHGKTENIVKLTLNGKDIHTSEDGAFSQLLVLPHGYSIVALEAEDRFGRKTTLTREFVYTPESTGGGV